MTALLADISSTDTRPVRVIVGVDDSPGGLSALRWAVEFARSQGATLVAVRAWGLGLPRHGGRRHRGRGHEHVVFAFRGAAPCQAAARLTEQAFRTAAGGIPADLDVTVETPEGDPGLVLTVAARAGSDLLVVGTAARHGLKRLVHGSVSAYCARRARCPVAVIEAGRPHWYPGHIETTSTQSEPLARGRQARG
jgi:nucleotide-binding universal stress UspA family protein